MDSPINPYEPFQPQLDSKIAASQNITIKERPPCDELKGIVHSYIQVTTTGPLQYKVVPDGMEAFYISPCGVMILGVCRESFEVNITQSGQYFGVRFYPGMLKRFTIDRFPDITSKPITHEPIWRETGDLHTQIYQKSGFDERAQICDSWLIQRLSPNQNSKLIEAVNVIFENKGCILVSTLAEKVNLSARQLNRVFRKHTGLSTKAMIQTIRLQCACRNTWLSESPLSEVALELGYYDQSHFTNDYRRFMSN
ncbi:helix-turn-helix domain-containing protein [Vibrio penaeicida]|uniref:Transcriptional regulator n=1 Tax=Vibrio penaeicida TaxID=104609 RepID=A0AAV5P0I8_9VIBR|nr:helix-turn-helix domain-containing protein [Vibrio penaeicida]RTZ23679.1 AraC family transcriptional regulator [Vibrio penaeicida]GLQ76485.1 transcriptional regulator [Vibrio penaeicida]